MTFTPGSIAPGASNVQLDFVSGSAGYGAILADPPWRFKVRSVKGNGRSPDGQSRAAQRNNRPENHYPTMSLEDIRALPVASIAARDCVLFLWCVDPLLPEAIEVGRSWGFAYKTVAFVWPKLRREASRRGNAFDDPWHKQFPMGTGYWTRANPELCLLFTRGRPKRLATDVRKLLIAPRREHSRKPDETHTRIMRLVDGPYLELFARERRPGWDAWGSETNKFSEAETTPCPASPSRQTTVGPVSSVAADSVSHAAPAGMKPRANASGRSRARKAEPAMPLFAPPARTARRQKKTSAKPTRPSGKRAANLKPHSNRRPSRPTFSE